LFGEFFLIEKEDAPVVRAERLAFGETAGRDEAWLQELLFEHPEILPVREIDPTFFPLVPLCRELRTEAGPLDLAYINQHGRLTLVECKLWRNPEARRKVIAQVLDYARAISRWSYSDLQRQVSAATKRKGNVPFENAKQVFPDLEEARFIDDAYSAMRDGRFLLLIAGDGIREDVGAITELVNRNAAAGFSFGLVEVALYGIEDGSLAIQPRVVAKTQLIERTVVLVRDKEQMRIVQDEEGERQSFHEGSDQPNELGESSKQAEYRRFWAPVLEMSFDDPDQESPKLYYPNHVRTPLQWPGTWITAYRYGGDAGNIGVGTGGRAGADQKIMKLLEPHKAEILDALPDTSEYKLNYKGDGYCFAIQRQIQSFDDDRAAQEWASTTMNEYINVLRPWIDRVNREAKD
jgi:hypothetical protein